jgi:uncharacterized protein (TIGR00299 family) protein
VRRHLHIDPFSGLAGDMFVAALVHLGAPAGAMTEALNSIRFPGVDSVELRFHDVESHGVRGLRLEISITPRRQTAHRHYAEIRDAIASAALEGNVRRRALEALETVGRAEAAAHGVALEEVHFHELGGFDSVVDFVGAALGIEALGVESVTSNPLPLGRGEIRSAHGTLPSPAPATLEILKGLPTVGLDIALELVTPTGAALAKTFVGSFGPPPPMVLEAVGAGFGSSSIPGRPNCVRLFAGDDSGGGLRREPMLLLETNLDDLPAEVLGTLIATCIGAGAIDAWLTPTVMKKGRPAHVLSALCREEVSGALEEAFFRHSSTLGVRRTRIDRDALERRWEKVVTPWGPVRLKLGVLNGAVVNRAPEFEDCAALAERAGVPVKEVYGAALAGWQAGADRARPLSGSLGKK